MEPRTILIVCDNPEFPREITSRWQGERTQPQFRISGTQLRAPAPNFDLVILAPQRREVLRACLRALEVGHRPVIVLADDEAELPSLRGEFPRALVLHCAPGWADVLVLLAGEVLRRLQALARAERAEQVSHSLRSQATLGQYMVEMRHTVNNALTSVLGNAELLLLEPGAFSAGVRSQIDTIRNMALRMHEILQRFSSLEKELMFAGEQAAKQQKSRGAAAVQ